ncbi:cytoplasmic protein [Ottowia sp. GY511]|uniref:Cytoplasmic protein n=1 Tax=Ottowia flava TaxID=2675430 RepID=A0ABW4KVZ6_9BURK|nr:cytoplasmic protein [Ottowia sp. GY511]TXK22410.1 cytoplasmic protein [Ottowia sp. GY511]
MTQSDVLSRAVAHSCRNRDEVMRSDACACFHCFVRFEAHAIRLWTDSEDPRDDDPGALRDDASPFPGATACCPACGYDSVIGSASGFALDIDFLRQLRTHWHRAAPGDDHDCRT